MSILGSILALAMLIGTVAGLLTTLRSGDAWGMAVALGTAAVLARASTGKRGLCAAACFCVASALGAEARDRTLRPPLLDWFDATTTSGFASAIVSAEGELVSDATRSDAGVRLLVDLERPARGRVLVHVAGDLAFAQLEYWTAGRRVRFPVTLRRFQLLRNVGGPSPHWQTLRRPASLAGSVKSAALVEVEPGTWVQEGAARVRRRVRESVTRVIGGERAQAAAIVVAILIGDRAGLDDEVERQLQAAGTYHVIAISGGNIAFLVAVCLAVLRVVLRSTRAVSAVTLGIVLWFGAIVGGEPSVFRAITAASLYLIAVLIGVVPSPLAVIRTTAVVLAIVNPLDAIDPGAWLSYGATLGIVLLAARWARLAAGSAWVGLATLPRVLLMLVSATLAAEAVIAPISATVFGRVSTAGVLLNLVAIPSMAIIQATGFAVVVLDVVSTTAANGCGSLAIAATDALVGSSELVDFWPWLSWRVPPAHSAWVVAYYGACALCLIPAAARWRRFAFAGAVISIAVIVTGAGVGDRGPADGRARVTVLDVGQGDAILVQAPGGHAMLVDTGGTAGTFDIGGRVVTPAVWALGSRRLSTLTLTHGDRDHVGGAIAVMQDLRPQEIWEGVPVPRDIDRARIRSTARQLGIPWRTIQEGDRVEIGDVHIEAVRPPRPEWERQKVRNDDSIVLRVRFGRVELWLTGDAGAEFEARMPVDADAAAVRILKVGHHGSRTSTSAALVAAIRPQIAVISVGAGNLFGHPAPEVTERLAAVGAEVFRTDRDGAVVVELDGSTAFVWTPTGRQWSVGVLGPDSSEAVASRPSTRSPAR